MQYKNVGLPKVLYDKFREIQSEYGWRNFSEFVVESVRDRIEDLVLAKEVRDYDEEENLSIAS